ncbi:MULTISPECIES: SIMPL domain-containing protein [Aneurinibacillus]|uniref:SIMPL domain-containing protein n=1 Tax=Aneurinibacillus thermoaerophilus TaxID=143495 RepID=A0A1G7XYY2_ANETH|nr:MULTISPECIES: SIMPL domain-containing protein [Aneurinibacillus]AMA73001.1 hypothetical protein ACH33_09110 [Aneurinibacillus sp. XH2]MED0675951.1 SIMPL domain-containing protein [Aneurinibacillus thermoaerophilus]MED0737523.1 SIMPL domain-containing protein [Aneurinibacillus thermoaerophilus]MED0758094.1 SIMPL domain-containing protein [Aneurinibacillus thermoaerophilus]MED0761248.1 SIMPL domain-containing protein [Aneurinibacillus thermoaerophilus]
MKNIPTVRTLSCALLLGMSIISGWVPAAYAQTSVQSSEVVAPAALRTITVTGHGEVTVQPDIAYIQLGLYTTGKTAREAQEKNAQQFKTIHNALIRLQIAEKDIQTVRFSTMPEYTWENNKQQFKGYQVEQIVQIKYRNLEKIGQVMDTAVAVGANRIENVWFSSEKIEEHKLAAMDKAMDNARLKAERIAKHAGVKIKDIVQITDNITPQPIPMYRQSVVADYSAQEKSNASSQVYPGELKIESTVTATYSY